MVSIIKKGCEPYLTTDRVQTLSYPRIVVCSLCKGILWLPKACRHCETPYCLSCIKNRQVEPSEPIQCPPSDCSEFIERNCPPSIRYILSLLQVKCRYTSNGCKETLPYDNLETHEEVCDYRPKTCSGCQKEIIKKDFQEHNNTCTLVSLTCSECETVYKRKNEEKHTEIECLRIQLRQQKKKLNELESLVQRLLLGNQVDNLTDNMIQLSTRIPNISESWE